MKKVRFMFLTLLSVTFILLLTSCRCDPAKHMWYVERFERNTLFANGVEAVEAYDGIPDIEDPFGDM